MEKRRKYRLTLICIIITFILLVATVYGMSEARKTAVIDLQSEYGKELTGIAEKAIGDEGIDTNDIVLQSIVQDSPNSIMLTFHGVVRFSNGVVYSNNVLDEEKPVTFFAADIDYSGHTNTVVLDKTYRYGKDYLCRKAGNSLEVIDLEVNGQCFSCLNIN